jgi:hypothetical protein
MRSIFALAATGGTGGTGSTGSTGATGDGGIVSNYLEFDCSAIDFGDFDLRTGSKINT